MNIANLAIAEMKTQNQINFRIQENCEVWNGNIKELDRQRRYKRINVESNENLKRISITLLKVVMQFYTIIQSFHKKMSAFFCFGKLCYID